MLTILIDSKSRPSCKGYRKSSGYSALDDSYPSFVAEYHATILQQEEMNNERALGTVTSHGPECSGSTETNKTDSGERASTTESGIQ